MWEVRFFCRGIEEGIEALAEPIFVRGVSPFYGSGPAVSFHGRRASRLAGAPHARTWRASRCFLHGSGIPRRFPVLFALYLAQNIVEGLCGAGYGVDDF